MILLNYERSLDVLSSVPELLGQNRDVEAIQGIQGNCALSPSAQEKLARAIQLLATLRGKPLSDRLQQLERTKCSQLVADIASGRKRQFDAMRRYASLDIDKEEGEFRLIACRFKRDRNSFLYYVQDEVRQICEFLYPDTKHSFTIFIAFLDILNTLVKNQRQYEAALNPRDKPSTGPLREWMEKELISDHPVVRPWIQAMVELVRECDPEQLMMVAQPFMGENITLGIDLDPQHPKEIQQAFVAVWAQWAVLEDLKTTTSYYRQCLMYISETYDLEKIVPSGDAYGDCSRETLAWTLNQMGALPDITKPFIRELFGYTRSLWIGWLELHRKTSVARQELFKLIDLCAKPQIMEDLESNFSLLRERISYITECNKNYSELIPRLETFIFLIMLNIKELPKMEKKWQETVQAQKGASFKEFMEKELAVAKKLMKKAKSDAFAGNSMAGVPKGLTQFLLALQSEFHRTEQTVMVSEATFNVPFQIIEEEYSFEGIWKFFCNHQVHDPGSKDDTRTLTITAQGLLALALFLDASTEEGDEERKHEEDLRVSPKHLPSPRAESGAAASDGIAHESKAKEPDPEMESDTESLTFQIKRAEALPALQNAELHISEIKQLLDRLAQDIASRDRQRVFQTISAMIAEGAISLEQCLLALDLQQHPIERKKDLRDRFTHSLRDLYHRSYRDLFSVLTDQERRFITHTMDRAEIAIRSLLLAEHRFGAEHITIQLFSPLTQYAQENPHVSLNDILDRTENYLEGLFGVLYHFSEKREVMGQLPAYFQRFRQGPPEMSSSPSSSSVKIDGKHLQFVGEAKKTLQAIEARIIEFSQRPEFSMFDYARDNLIGNHLRRLRVEIDRHLSLKPEEMSLHVSQIIQGVYLIAEEALDLFCQAGNIDDGISRHNYIERLKALGISSKTLPDSLMTFLTIGENARNITRYYYMYQDLRDFPVRSAMRDAIAIDRRSDTPLFPELPEGFKAKASSSQQNLFSIENTILKEMQSLNEFLQFLGTKIKKADERKSKGK